jgi:hypothetical protein
MFGWIGTIESGTHDDDGGNSCFEGSEVRRSIDADGAAGPDGDVGICKVVDE